MVSSGCPTASSWWSTLNQALPLNQENSIKDTLNVEFDQFTKTLARGNPDYERVFFSSTNPNFDGKDKWLDKEAVVHWSFFEFENEKYQSTQRKSYTSKWNNDRILLDQLKREITRLDSRNETSPLLFWILSVSTHIPYTGFDFDGNVGSGRIPVSKVEKYVRVIKYMDRYLAGEFVTFLKSRKQANNTVIILMGDHASYGQGQGFKCPDCPPTPFEHDQRKKLRIPPPGTRDYRAVSHFDVVATVLDLAGADDEVTHGFGRSLLDSSIQDEARRTLSINSEGAELGLPSVVVRSDWLGNAAIKVNRPHPTWTDKSRVSSGSSYVKTITSANNAWNDLVKQNRVWHTNFTLSSATSMVDDLTVSQQPLQDPSSGSFGFLFLTKFSLFLVFFGLRDRLVFSFVSLPRLKQLLLATNNSKDQLV
ncbi:hypothetical protein RCL1_005741 [Eukaryota sp. TZLM3-RCL]